MDFSTYDDNEPVNFIMCNICNAKIRGDTMYKIHLTEFQHLKKEEALVAAGTAKRAVLLPRWTSLCQYLDYLQLDEPVIGLQHVVEIDSDIPWVRYRCQLCSAEGDLPGITTHILSRKHRHKYLVAKRPDLVTWDVNTIQSGKLVRAKAEVVERQDGRGIPQENKRRRKPLITQLGLGRAALRDKLCEIQSSPQRSGYQGSPRVPEASGFDRWQVRKEARALMRMSAEQDGYGGERLNEDSYRWARREEDYNEQGYQDKGPYEGRYQERSPAGQQWTKQKPYGQDYAEGYSVQQGSLEEPSYREDFAQGSSYSRSVEWDVCSKGVDRQGYIRPRDRDERSQGAREYQPQQGRSWDHHHEDTAAGRPGNRGNSDDLPERSSDRGLGFGFSKGSGVRTLFGSDEGRRTGLHHADHREGTAERHNLQHGTTRRTVYYRESAGTYEGGPHGESDDFPRKRMRTDPGTQQQVMDYKGPRGYYGDQARSFREPPEALMRGMDRRHAEDNTSSQLGYQKDISRGPAFDPTHHRSSGPSHPRAMSPPRDAWLYPNRLEKSYQRDSPAQQTLFRHQATPPHSGPPARSSLDKITSTLLQLVAQGRSL